MFSIPVFFVVFRETIEAAVIVSVLLAFLSRTLRHKHPRLHKMMRLQVNSWTWKTASALENCGLGGPSERAVRRSFFFFPRFYPKVWAGTAVGLAVSLAVGMTFVVLWDQLSASWEANEALYEGIFCLVACVFVTMEEYHPDNRQGDVRTWRGGEKDDISFFAKSPGQRS
ncbi:MAG: hypothetical protein BJ554DRAFT_5884, partial [Olpidium bornovanus]